VSHPLERRVARLEHLVQARPRLPSAEELLGEETADVLRADWATDAYAHIGPALGWSDQVIWELTATLARELGTHPRMVTRAVLRHLAEWPTLDAAGRAAAVAEERGIEWDAELLRVAAAVEAHGLPLCAPDLSPPLTWPYAWIDRHLQAFVAAGWLSDTGERRRSWPVYAWAARGDRSVEPGPGTAGSDATD